MHVTRLLENVSTQHGGLEKMTRSTAISFTTRHPRVEVDIYKGFANQMVQ